MNYKTIQELNEIKNLEDFISSKPDDKIKAQLQIENSTLREKIKELESIITNLKLELTTLRVNSERKQVNLKKKILN